MEEINLKQIISFTEQKIMLSEIKERLKFAFAPIYSENNQLSEKVCESLKKAKYDAYRTINVSLEELKQKEGNING